MSICTYTKKNGFRCRSKVKTGKEFCSFHDPINQEAMAKGRAAGSQVMLNGGKPRLPPTGVRPKKLHELATMLGEVIDEVRSSQLDCKAAQAINDLAETLRKTLVDVTAAEQMDKIQQRLAKLEGGNTPEVNNVEHDGSAECAGEDVGTVREEAQEDGTGPVHLHIAGQAAQGRDGGDDIGEDDPGQVASGVAPFHF